MPQHLILFFFFNYYILNLIAVVFKPCYFYNVFKTRLIYLIFFFMKLSYNGKRSTVLGLKLVSNCLIQDFQVLFLPVTAWTYLWSEACERAWSLAHKLFVDDWPILVVFSAISKLYHHNQWAFLPTFKQTFAESLRFWVALKQPNYSVVFLEGNNFIVFLYLFGLLSLLSTSPCSLVTKKKDCILLWRVWVMLMGD